MKTGEEKTERFYEWIQTEMTAAHIIKWVMARCKQTYSKNKIIIPSLQEERDYNLHVALKIEFIVWAPGPSVRRFGQREKI